MRKIALTLAMMAAAVALIVLAVSQARAETRVWVADANGERVPYLCDDAHFRVGCRKDWATIKRQVAKRRAPEVRAWRYEDEEDTKPRQACLERQPRVRVVGNEAHSVANAKISAETAWRKEVRYQSGERFTDLDRAHRLKWGCARSNTGESLLARSAEKIIGEDASVMIRCRLEADPCAVPLEDAGK